MGIYQQVQILNAGKFPNADMQIDTQMLVDSWGNFYQKQTPVKNKLTFLSQHILRSCSSLGTTWHCRVKFLPKTISCCLFCRLHLSPSMEMYMCGLGGKSFRPSAWRPEKMNKRLMLDQTIDI